MLPQNDPANTGGAPIYQDNDFVRGSQLRANNQAIWENLEYLDGPAGRIMSWIGGYFQDGSNGSFTNILGNTIANANIYLNPFGWHICDGTLLNDPDSPIFNGAGRYLPNLLDARFLMGSPVVSGQGGANSVALSIAELPNHLHDAGHNHHVNLSGTTGGSGEHSHDANIDSSVAAANNVLGNTSRGSTISAIINPLSQEPDHTHSINLSGPSDSYTGTTGAVGSGLGHANRPQYLTCFYMMKVK